jgi:hypothetical protein
MEIYEKRDRWCVKRNGKLFKFLTKGEAELFMGVPQESVQPLETYAEDIEEETEE